MELSYIHWTFHRLVYGSALSVDSSSDELLRDAWSYHQRQVPTWQKWLLSAALPLLKLFIRNSVQTKFGPSFSANTLVLA